MTYSETDRFPIYKWTDPKTFAIVCRAHGLEPKHWSVQPTPLFMRIPNGFRYWAGSIGHIGKRQTLNGKLAKPRN